MLLPVFNDKDPKEKIEDMAAALRNATDKLSMVITILAGLEAVFGKELEHKTSLTIHLIGATAKELDALMLFEELLHLLPNLKSIHTQFIGLELPRPVDSGSTELDCCEPCQAPKRTRSMGMLKGSYTDYVRSQQVFRAPDMAVLFHTGHSQEAVQEWKPTIRYLAHASFPSLFTSYNRKEMEEETAGLKGMGAKFIVEGVENRWRGLRPLLEVAEEREGATFFMNGFWYVVAAEN